MRFGLSGAFLPERVATFSAATASRVRELGFSGVFTRFTEDDVHALGPAECQRVRELLESEGLVIFQASGYRPTLVHPDEDARREATRTLCAALRVAGWLGARSVDTGPGSMSPRGPWWPDPYNYTPEARDQLVKSVREAARAAEEHGVLLCLEGHQLVTLRSPEVMLDVVDEVGSPWVKVDFDPVNWLTLETVYESGQAIADTLELLGDRVASAHVKDAVLQDRGVVHIDEAVVGRGLLDLPALLSGMERLDPQAPVIVEAVEEDDVSEVSALLHRTADEQGIEVLW
jgi:sugar phosphate isomerase/epimerase